MGDAVSVLDARDITGCYCPSDCGCKPVPGRVNVCGCVAHTVSRIEALRRIVSDSQHATVEGVLVDLFTASAMVQVFDALSPANQAKFDSVPLVTLAVFAMKKVS